MADIKKPLTNKEETHKYQQEAFRRIAQREIDKTMERLNPHKPNSFAKMQQKAFSQAMEKMTLLGYYTAEAKPRPGLSKKQTDHLFETYYNSFLDRIKNGDAQEILDAARRAMLF